MSRVLAGVIDPGAQAAAGRAVAGALGAEGKATIWCHGDLTVGATGPRVWPEGIPPGCLFNGELLPPLGDLEPRLAAAYSARGEGALADLRGDFAAFLFDPISSNACLVRDPLGGRPLFLHRDGRRLAFASEIRVLLRLLPRRPEVDHTAAVAWLARGLQPGDRTLFEGVTRLPPGCALRLGSRPTLHRMWQPRYAGQSAAGREEWAARLSTGIRDSVARRLPQSGPAGVMLSGGLDSSAVAGVACDALAESGGTARAYTAVFPEHPGTDESAYAELVASEHGLRWVRARVEGGGALAAALDYQLRWGVPAPSPNRFFEQPLLRRAAEDGVLAALDGQGGDELFGASAFLIADRLGAARVGSAVALAQDLAGEHSVRGDVVARILTRYGLRGLIPHELHAALRARRDPMRYVPAWLSPRSADLLRGAEDPWSWKRLDGPAWWASLADTLTVGREAAGVATHLTREADSAKLDARHPFLDLDLVELVLSAPPELAFDRRLDRPLLRAAVKGSIPERVHTRLDKVSFNAVQNDALAFADGPTIRTLLDSREARVNAYVSPGAVRAGPLSALARHRRGEPGGWTMAVWRLLTLECWLRELEDPGFAKRLLRGGDLAPGRVVLDG